MTARALAADVRRVGPDLLVRDRPLRVLRLSRAGQAALDALLSGRPDRGAETLGRTLSDAGMLQRAQSPSRLDDLSVVIPARAEVGDVRRVLAGIPSGVPVVVVDDGSPRPLGPDLRGVQVVRHESSAGPSAARNAGSRCVGTPLIAFVDADVELPPGALEQLTSHFADSAVVAVAPRVVSRSAPGWVGVLERQLCALDQGTRSGRVGPGWPVSYVPSTVLLVRSDVLGSVGGFDELLHTGEDVDLVWRLAQQGEVHYDAGVVVRHGPRPSVRAGLRRRAAYGTSSAPLDRRHPGQVRHLALSRWSALPWAASLVHPLAGAAVTAALVAAAPRGMPGLPPAQARRVAATGQWAAFAATGRYAVRPAAPLTAAALVMLPRARRLAPLLLAGYLVGSGPRLTAGPARDALRRAALILADDIAYSAGVWSSALQHRRPQVLLPALVRRQQRGTEPTAAGPSPTSGNG